MERSLMLIFALIAMKVSAMHVPYSEASHSDQWLHEFYSRFIDEFTEEILKASRGESCESPLRKLEIVRAELEFYRIRGISSNATLAINQFLSFSKELDALCKANEMLKEEKILAVMKMWDNVVEMKKLVGEIDQIVYYNETTPLHFDTSKLKEALIELEKLLDFYSTHFFTQTEIEGIWVFVSKSKPILFEEIKIWIYSRNVTPVRLFIDETIFEAQNMSYRFFTLGEHFIYAEGFKGDKLVKSNVIKVFVKKIPVYINLKAYSAFVGKYARVEGYVSDYYGSALSVPLNINGDEMRAENGYFSITLKRDYECAVNVQVYYAGNETHEEAFANVSVYFSRYPTWIKLKTEKDRIFEWENAKFFIEASEYLPISIFSDNVEMFDFYAKNYNFSLKLKPGIHKFYAYFEGDQWRKPAKSNEVAIVVETFNLAPLFLIPFVLISLLFATKFLNKKPKKLETPREEKKSEKIEKEELKDSLENERDLSKFYAKVFDKLVTKYNLDKGITPRELLKILEKERFAKELMEFTAIHEKVTYGMQKISEFELEKFFKLGEKIISEI